MWTPHTLPRSPSLPLPLSCLIPLGFWAEGPLYRGVRAGLRLGATGMSARPGRVWGPQVCREARPGLGATGVGKLLLFVCSRTLCSAVLSYLAAKDTVRCCCLQPPFALK